MRRLLYFRPLALSAAAALLFSATYVDGQESGVIDFGSDPGLILDNEGESMTTATIRTEDSVLDLTMFREEPRVRYAFPLQGEYFGNENNFKGRVRFAVVSSSAGTDIEAGFFASDEENMGDSGSDSATQVVIEGLGSSNYPARWFGGAGGYDRRGLNIDAATWYVYDFEFQPVPETATVSLFQGDGVTLIDAVDGTITGGATSGIGFIDTVGFGNLDCCPDGSSMDVVIDWMTYSVNTTLPADPTYAPDNVIIPDPGPQRTWNADSGGDWTNGGNWDPALAPDDAEHIVTFGDAISQSRTVFTDVPVTVNSITFDNASEYAVGGTATVNLSASATADPSITVSQGSHQFQSQVDLNADTAVDVADGGVLTFNNALNLNGNTLTQSGAGTVTINNVLNTGGGTVSLTNGTLNGSGEVGGDVNNSGGTVAPGNSPGILTIDGNFIQGGTGTLALEIGGLVAGDDHDKLEVGGDVTLDGTVTVQLINGFSPQNADSFDMLDFASFSGSPIFDFDLAPLDGDLMWDTSQFSTSGLLFISGGLTLPDGDFDASNRVGVDDLNLVLFNWNSLGSSLPAEWSYQRPGDNELVGVDQLNLVLFNWNAMGSSTAAVPEPAAAVLFGVACLWLCCGSTKRRLTSQ